MIDRKAKPSIRDVVTSSVVLPFVLALAVVVVVPALLVGGPVSWAYGHWLRRQWERTWGRQGKRILLVYSRSPHWQSYIETTWLPRLAPHAVVVDWSDRSRWPTPVPIEIRAFRRWGGHREFNPLALLFPKDGDVRAIRFRRAFRDFKHGKEHALRRAEAELFEFVDAIRSDAV